MREMIPTDGHIGEEESDQDKIADLGINRRQFLFRAAGLGLAATALPAFLAACQQLEAGPEVSAATTAEKFPTPSIRFCK